MSKITDAIAGCKKKLSLMSESLLVKLNHEFNLSMEEFKLFQDMICQATEKTLNIEESCQVFSYLGQSQDGFNKQPLEVKIVLLQVLISIWMTQECNNSEPTPGKFKLWAAMC